jgi:hypothetical protein
MAVIRVAGLLLPVAGRKDGSGVKGMTATGRSLASGTQHCAYLLALNCDLTMTALKRGPT